VLGWTRGGICRLFAWLLATALFGAAPAFAQIFFAASEDSTLVAKPNPVFYRVNDEIFIHVRNGPGDTVPFNNKIIATVATTRGDVETVFLFETDVDSVYTGRIQAQFGPPQAPPTPNDGNLEVRGNDTVTVTALAFPAITATIRIDGTIKLLEPRENDDILNQPNQPLPDQSPELKLITVGKSIYIRVIDDDQNTDENSQQSVQVTISSAAGDVENVALTETTADSGIFMALIRTDFQVTPILGDLILSIDAGVDSVIATYADPLVTNGNLPLPATADVRSGVDATGTVSPNPLTPGGTFTLSVTDQDEFADRNLGPGNDTVNVTITSFDAAGNIIDREFVEVGEDNLTPAQFTRVFPYSFLLTGLGDPFDGVISVRAGGRVESTYNDELRQNGQTHVPVPLDPLPLPVAFNNTVPTATFTADLDCNGNIARIEPGDTVFLCVRDRDADLTPNTDRVTVTLITNVAVANQDTENVVLTETGPRTGVFTGSIDSKFADAVNTFVIVNNGQLDVRGRDVDNVGVAAPQVRGRYTSVNGLVLAADITLNVNIDGQVLFTRDGSGTSNRKFEVRANEPIFIRIIDDDANRDPAVQDTLSVTFTSFSGSPAPAAGPILFPAAPGSVDQEILTLQETGVNTGIFVIQPTTAQPFNALPTRFLAAGVGTANGVLEMRATADIPGIQTNSANTVVAEYQDVEITSGPGVAFPRDTIFIRKGADATVAVNDIEGGGVAIGGNPLTITITGDRDAALANPAVITSSDFESGPGNETRSVTVSSRNAGGAIIDQEVLVVSEDNLVEGNFLGLLDTRFRTTVAVPPASPPVNDGVLEIVQSGSIVATFTDYLTNDGEPDRLITSAAFPVAPPQAGIVSIVNSEDPDTTANVLNNLVRIQPGDTVYFRVADRDLRIVPNGDTNEVTVTVVSFFIDPVGGGEVIEDTEIVNLRTAAGVDPVTGRPRVGVFLGHLPTLFGETIDVSAPPDARPNDGTLQVRGRSQIRATYIDANPGANLLSNVVLVELLGQTRWLTNGGRTEQQGNNIIKLDGRAQALKVFNSIPQDSLTVRAGNPVFVAVVDDDANLSPNQVDTVTVRIQTTAGDVENPILTETTFESGVFSNGIASDGIRTQLVVGPPTPGDGILQVRPDDQIIVDYIDATLPTPPLGNPGAVTLVSDNMQVQTAEDAILTAVDITGDNPAGTIKAGNPILITVTEPNAEEPRFDPNVIDTINVTVTSGTVAPNTDFETVLLFETGLDTRVFSGSLPTAHLLVGVARNNILEIADTNAARRAITVTYIDPQPRTPGSRTGTALPVIDTSNVLAVNGPLLTRLGANAAVSLIGIQSQSPNEFILGDTLRVSVTDPNFAGSPINTINVTVTAPSGDEETIALTRVLGSQADFTNDANPLPTTFDQSIVRGDGILEAVGGATSTALRGEPIRVTYVVGLDAQGRMMVPVIAGPILAFTRATVRFAVDRRLGPPAGPPPAQPFLPEPQPRFGLQENDLFTKDDTLTMVQAGDRIFIRVVDPDQNFPSNNPQVPNTVRVTLTTVNLGANAPGDSEVVVLSEQPRLNGETVRGVFVGSIVTVFANPPNTTATGNNGVLQLIGHDLITATYVDINTNPVFNNTRLINTITTSTEVKSTGDITIVDSATGITVTPIISLMPMPGNQTALLFIRVFDKDFDTDNRPGTDAGPQLTITTDRGDREQIPSVESTVTPGEFRATIPVVFGRLVVPGSGRLEVVGRDLVTVCYTDTLNLVPGTPIERCTTARVEENFGGTLEVLVPRTGLYQEPNRLEEFIIGEPLRIRVRDIDQDLTAGRDAVTVTLVTNNPTKQDQETLVLTETGNSTGVFEGEIPTAFPDIVNSPPAAAGRFNNGILTATGGDLLTITYLDAQDGTGQKNVPIVGTLTFARDYRATVSLSNTATDNSAIVLPNGARLIVPPGSLHLKETIIFELKYRTQYIDEFGKIVPPPLNPDIVLVGDSGKVGFYEVRPSNLVFKKLATFEIPIPSTVTVQGSNTMLSDADRQRLKLFYFDGFDWQPSAGTFFRDSGGREFIRAVSNHLTVFTLALDNRPAPRLAGSLLSSITLDKNPFTPNGDGINDNVIIQFGLGATATVSVKVVDVNGDNVRTLLDKGTMQPGFNTLQWDGRYAFSVRQVPPGMYVIVVKAEAANGSDTQSVGVGVMR
jgi:hypothetical protein